MILPLLTLEPIYLPSSFHTRYPLAAYISSLPWSLTHSVRHPPRTSFLQPAPTPTHI